MNDLHILDSTDNGDVVSYTVKYHSAPTKCAFFDKWARYDFNRPALRKGDEFAHYIDLWRLRGYYSGVEVYHEDGTLYTGPLTWCQDCHHVNPKVGPTDAYWRSICKDCSRDDRDAYRQYGGMPHTYARASYLYGEFYEGEKYTIKLTAVNTILKDGTMNWEPRN